jgi:RNA polymerase primary sigma factor
MTQRRTKTERFLLFLTISGARSPEAWPVGQPDVAVPEDTGFEHDPGVSANKHSLTETYAATLAEIGREFGVCREQIRQIESRAKRRMRRPNRMRLTSAERAAGFTDRDVWEPDR